jgi:diguanylate cyclase (GGDEF)-like protein
LDLFSKKAALGKAESSAADPRRTPTGPGERRGGRAPAGNALEADSAQGILDSVGELVYEWTIADDRLRWAGDIRAVLGMADPSAIATGKGFASFLDPDNMTSRYDAVMNGRRQDEGSGVTFQIEYKMRPEGRLGAASRWIEEHGKWYAGSDGRPARVVGVVRCIDERHENEQRLRYLGTYDPLTGYINRARLAEVLQEAVAGGERHRMPCAFVLAAIDNLAMINDAYGFDVADEVIANVAKRLRGQLRGGDSIGRYAGNKLGAVLTNCSDQDMHLAADRLLRCVREKVVETSAGSVAVTISVGGVSIPRNARTADEAMVRAEEALNQVKSRHNDNFVAFQHSSKRESLRKRNIHYADEIISALNDRRLTIAYQPIVDAHTGKPKFYECLLRVLKDDHTAMSAGHLIPVAEQIGLVRLIDHRVLELTVAKLESCPDMTLSLNISGKTASDPEWLAKLTSTVQSRRELAQRLIVEITETVAIQDIEESSRFVSSLRNLGCRVAIDDFGAGYTSFRNLKMLHVDMVKIDGCFVENLIDNPDDQFFVRTLIDLAKNFKIATVAEWVEDERSAELLRGWGIDYLQGHLFGAAELDTDLPLKTARSGGSGPVIAGFGKPKLGNSA